MFFKDYLKKAITVALFLRAQAGANPVIAPYELVSRLRNFY